MEMLGLWELSRAPLVIFSCSFCPRQSGLWVPTYGCSETALSVSGGVKAHEIPLAALGAGAQKSHGSCWSSYKSVLRRTLKGAGTGDLYSFTHSVPPLLLRCYASSEHVLEIQETNKRQGMSPSFLRHHLLHVTVPCKAVGWFSKFKEDNYPGKKVLGRMVVLL